MVAGTPDFAVRDRLERDLAAVGERLALDLARPSRGGGDRGDLFFSQNFMGGADRLEARVRR